MKAGAFQSAAARSVDKKSPPQVRGQASLTESRARITIRASSCQVPGTRLSPAPSVIVPAPVMVVWLGLAASRQWKSEARWIDRAGRLIGIFWLMTITIDITGFVWGLLEIKSSPPRAQKRHIDHA